MTKRKAKKSLFITPSVESITDENNVITVTYTDGSVITSKRASDS